LRNGALVRRCGKRIQVLNDEDADIEPTQSYLVLTAGMRISHYTIVNKIGSGGMGEVYLAEDSQLKRKVALKFLRGYLTDEGNYRARFLREAQAAAALDHDNIVTIHDVGEYNSRPFFAMQYIEGRSLSRILKEAIPDLPQAVDYLIQMCEGLSEAHRAGVVHRDIKPSNVVVDSHQRVKLLDFGLATIRGAEQLTRGGTAYGTLGYTAPEIIKGQQADARSDIFSVGVVIYELLTGQRPFLKDDEAATLHAIAYDTPEPVDSIKPDTPAGLSLIVDKALEKDPDKRYQTADQLLDELKTVARELDEGTYRRSARMTRLVRTWRRRPRYAALSLSALIIIVLAAVPATRNWIVDRIGGGRVPTMRHLAVLPFHDLGNPGIGQPFCDGLMETLSSKLTQMEQFHGSLWVVPASEVREEKVSGVREARKRFGVNLAVSGSVQQLGDRVRLTLNLVDAKTSRQLRASVSDYSIADLESLQDSTVKLLADMLEVQLRPDEKQMLSAGETRSPAAYDLYVRARGYLRPGATPPVIDTAINLLNHALDYDADYVLALAALGEGYWRKYRLETDPQLRDQAIAASRRAVELNDKVAPAYVTLGIIYNGTGRYEQAVEVLNQALDLDSTNRAASLRLGSALESLNQLDSAEAVYKRTIEMRPDHWSGYNRLGLFYAHHGHYADALIQANLAAALEPEGFEAWNDIGSLYFRIGNTDRAVEMWQRSLAIDRTYSALSNLGTIHLLRAEYDEAQAHYHEALDLNPIDYRIWLNYAMALRHLPGHDTEADTAYAEGIGRAEEQRRINPNDARLLADLADAYAAVHKPDSAVSLIERAREIAPENIEVIVTAGSVYEQIGNRPKAMEMIAGAIQRGFPPEQIEAVPELHDLTTTPQYDSLINARKTLSHDTL
jgi:tetratricopeptide (TPR) repeat protein/predicted Ser/Thr protein kinase